MIARAQDNNYGNKILLVGAGRGGSAILRLVEGVKDLAIVGVADIDPNAVGVKAAKEKGIPFFTDYKEALKKLDVDFVVDVTASPEVREGLNAAKNGKFEVISGSIAKLLWHAVEVRRKNEQEIKELLDEYKSLYDFGLMLSQLKSLNELFPAIIEQAMESTKCSASILAVYKERFSEMEIVAAKGFSKRFSKVKTWKIEPSGLTDKILNGEQPTLIENILKQTIDDETLADKEIKTIAASPLFAEDRVVGILYVADFEKRNFSTREKRILSLVSTLAALAIERAKLLADTELEAITDGLTGLFNRRYFMSRLEEETSRATRYNSNLSLIMIDVDYFKNFNDKYGHLEGDSLLAQIVDVLRKESRNEDTIARYGGEEFAVIMPQTDKEGAMIFAERIRKATQSKNFKNSREDLLGDIVTISCGIATCPSDASSHIELLERADKALYKAKESGRNRIEEACVEKTG